jgi:hypothetical protein
VGSANSAWIKIPVSSNTRFRMSASLNRRITIRIYY